MYEIPGITMNLGFDCLLPLIPNSTVWYFLHAMSMFLSLLCFALFWDQLKNLVDGLRISFDVPFVLKFDVVLRLSGFDRRSLLRTTYDGVLKEFDV